MKFLVRKFVFLFCVIVVVGGCSTQSVSVAGSGGRAEFIAEKWVPETQRALQVLQQYWGKQTGRNLREVPSFVLVPDSTQYKTLAAAGGATIPLLFNAPFLNEQVRVAMVQPLAMTIARDLSAKPSAQGWLMRGLAWWLAYRLVDPLRPDASSLTFLRARVPAYMRDAQSAKKIAQVFADDGLPMTEPMENADAAFVSYFFVDYLARRLGPRFEQTWPMWLSLRERMSDEQAFEQAFGVSVTAFKAAVKQEWEALKAQKFVHADPEKVAAYHAAVKTGSLATLPLESLRTAFERYQKQTAPKAFVYTPRGLFIYAVDAPNALELSLRGCRDVDGDKCRVFAIDDTVVELEQSAAEIQVEMFRRGSNEWANSVEQDWLPVLKKTVQYFESGLQTKLGIGLREPARVYLVANREDYAQLLRDKFATSERMASEIATLSGGISSGTAGGMVVRMESTMPPDMRWALVTKTTLHELTHEWQKQLGRVYAAFSPQRWINEGMADQVAELIGRDIPLDPSAGYEIERWQAKCIDWYLLSGVRTTKVTDVMNVTFSQWLQLGKDNKHPYQMSGLLVMHLQQRLGEKYWPSLIRYLSLAGEKGMTEPVAFEQSFGFSQQDFVKSAESWLATLGAVR